MVAAASLPPPAYANEGDAGDDGGAGSADVSVTAGEVSIQDDTDEVLYDAEDGEYGRGEGVFAGAAAPLALGRGELEYLRR